MALWVLLRVAGRLTVSAAFDQGLDKFKETIRKAVEKAE